MGEREIFVKTSLLKRALAALLALAAFTLPACSTVGNLDDSRETSRSAADALPTEGALTTPSYYTPETQAPDESYTPENQLKLLADRDFNSGYFLIVQEKGLENAIFPTSDELVNVYADRRNRLVQEKYNVQLTSRQMSAEEIINELSTNVKSGIYFCDLLIVSPALLVQLQEKELLISLDTLPFFELDSPCISAEATAEINAGLDGIYGIWGDVLRQPTRQLCVYFNETMADSLGVPNLYAAVRSGSWDFDKLLDAAETTASLDGVGGILYEGSAADLLFSASGRTSASKEGKALLADPAHLALVDRLSGQIMPAIEKGIAPLAEDDGGASNESAEDGSEGAPEDGAETPSDAYTRFITGQSLFYIGTQGELATFAHTQDVYGILPIPKYTAADEAYPTLTEQSELPVLACPMNVTSAAGTGIMLSALNAASCDEINDIFLQSAEQYVRTNGSFLMLPYLVGSPHFDRKLIFA